MPAPSKRGVDRWMWRLPVLGLVLAACAGFGSGACSKTRGAEGEDTLPVEPAASERIEIDLYAFGRQLGTIAPCGCTTDPLGGLQYAFGYIQQTSSSGSRLVLEPGSFLFPDPEGPEAPVDEAAWSQADRRASMLHERFSTLDGLVSGLGPTDFASPTAKAEALSQYALPRVLANASERPAGVESMRTIELGRGLTARVTAVVDPTLAGASAKWAPGFPALGDPMAALKTLQPELAQADLSVVMVHGPRELAESIARELDVDVVVMGGVQPNPERSRMGSPAVKLGRAWLLEPGDRAQSLGHLTLSIAASVPEGELPDEWTLMPSRTQREGELARLDEQLAKFAKDPSADAAFVERLQSERDAVKAELDSPALPDAPVVVIPEQVKVSCRQPVDETTAQALTDYDGWVAKQNLERFTGVHAPAPAPGKPTYVGAEACVDCHAEAVQYWEGTVHHRAYDTLVEANKQYDLSCVGCHVTGFRKPGGSEVVENELLRAVQCEQCHGPGSAHVEDPVPETILHSAPVSVCVECHTPDHSDTFDYEAYMRDVLGEGHGAAERAKLGPGPTGRELRAAGLAKAGGACKKP
ncbi:multiheme c-type cytochrome [Nannocystaceae bacterium ST9]